MYTNGATYKGGETVEDAKIICGGGIPLYLHECVGLSLINPQGSGCPVPMPHETNGL